MSEEKRPKAEIIYTDTTPPTSKVTPRRSSGVYIADKGQPGSELFEVEISDISNVEKDPTLKLIVRAIREIIDETTKALGIAAPMAILSTYMNPHTEYQRAGMEPLLKETQTPISRVLEICRDIQKTIKNAVISNAQVYGKVKVAKRVAHDTNNKVAAMQQAIAFLKDFFDNARDNNVTSKDIRIAKEDIGSIIQSMVSTLEIAVSAQNIIENNRFEPDTELNITSSVHEVSSSLSRESRFKFIHQYPIRTTGRLSELESLFFNVIQNAVKFSDDKDSPIEITITAKDQMAVITIKNEGPKIQEDIEQIFKDGHRDANAKNIPGTGTGLATCKEICHQHGGTITATNHDTGVIITITLPLLQYK